MFWPVLEFLNVFLGYVSSHCRALSSLVDPSGTSDGYIRPLRVSCLHAPLPAPPASHNPLITPPRLMEHQPKLLTIQDSMKQVPLHIATRRRSRQGGRGTVAG
jgi:hypothetical protein